MIELVLAGVISFAGFGGVIPRFFEAIDGVAQLENFKALRVFSIFYFLLPSGIILIFYWIFWGHKVYAEQYIKQAIGRFKYIFRLSRHFNQYGSFYSLLIALLYFLPILLFIKNQFNVEGGFIGFMVFYSMLSVVSLSFCTVRSLRLLVDIKTRFLFFRHWRVNTMINSFGLLVGIGFTTFAEPWIIYNSYFFGIVFASATFYLIICWAIYVVFLASWKVSKRALREIDKTKRNVILFTVFYLFGISVFPSLDVDSKHIVVAFATSITIFILVEVLSARISSLKGITVNAAFLVCSIVFIALSYYLLDINKLYLSMNRKYVFDRVNATNIVSDQKLVPLFVFSDQKEEAKISDAKRIRFYHLDSINHHIKYVPSDSLSHVYDNMKNPKDTNGFDHYVVKNFYYRRYADISKKIASENKSRIERYIYKRFRNSDSISNFYHDVYSHIDDATSLIAKTISLRDQIPEIRDYYHPINYYAANLKYYKNQREKALQAYSKLKEIEEISSVQNLNQDNQSRFLTSRLKDFRTLLVSKLDDFEEAVSAIREFDMEESALRNSFNISIDSMEVKIIIDSIRSEEKILKHLVDFKTNEYLDRYKRAQTVFLPYLLDSRRVGVYLLLLSFFILLISGLFIILDKGEKPAGLDRPRNVFFIWSIVLVILIVPLAQKIKPEFINPEHPTWLLFTKDWKPNLPLINQEGNKIEKPDLTIPNIFPSFIDQDSITIINIYDTTRLRSIDERLRKILVEQEKISGK